MKYFFFFQAEDGIRDGHVTGVQTCTLPIRIAVVALAAIMVIVLVIQAAIIAAVSAAVVGAIVPSAGQATSLLTSSSDTCNDTTQAPGGSDEVVGAHIEEKVWNYLRGAGYRDRKSTRLNSSH